MRQPCCGDHFRLTDDGQERMRVRAIVSARVSSAKRKTPGRSALSVGACAADAQGSGSRDAGDVVSVRPRGPLHVAFSLITPLSHGLCVQPGTIRYYRIWQIAEVIAPLHWWGQAPGPAGATTREYPRDDVDRIIAAWRAVRLTPVGGDVGRIARRGNARVRGACASPALVPLVWGRAGAAGCGRGVDASDWGPGECDWRTGGLGVGYAALRSVVRVPKVCKVRQWHEPGRGGEEAE